MFVRSKKVGARIYLQIVENRWQDGKVRQRVLASLGRLDRLQESGELDSLMQSASRFCQSLMVISAHRRGELPQVSNCCIGLALVFERLWKELGCPEVIRHAARGRYFQFDLERAVFLTVLHRLADPGSDRAAEKWKGGQRIQGSEAIHLHQLYRAMGWLGEPLGFERQAHRTPFAARCTKDLIEERLFARRRDLFSGLELVFFDTTSIYFEGRGGEGIGRRGKSKDHRPDRPQMIVAVVLDGRGVPVCSEMWPGNTADVSTLVPVAGRLQNRFSIRRICIVADRGMISQKTIEQLESGRLGWDYILGVRMRGCKEVREEVFSRAGRYREVRPPRARAKDPAPLKVKNVMVEDRRYILCVNEEQARTDALARQAIVESLKEKLEGSSKALVGNKGYRKYLRRLKEGFRIDEEKVALEARYDGKWVLRTNLSELSAEEVALKYKQLWMVEEMFRALKSLLETRPIWHKCDDTIRGHVFCSFLALVLRKELQDRLEERGWVFEWADVIQDLGRLEEIEVDQKGRRFMLRTQAQGVAGKVCQAVGVALPPTVRRVED